MREKLNENPMMQMAVIGVLIVVVGFIFLTRMKGGDSATDVPATTDPAATASSTPGATTDPTATPATTDPAAAAAADPTAIGAAPADGSIPSAAAPVTGVAAPFKAGQGLPKPVVQAYDAGGAVALLVSKQRGLDDKKMRNVVSSLRGESDVHLFPIAVHDVAKYSQITQGVDLDRVPALVVIQPKKFVRKGQSPTATVSYGYRTPSSVEQAIKDQLYHGKVLGYSPK